MSVPTEPSQPFVVRVAAPEEYAAAGELTARVYGGDGYVRGPYLEVLRDGATRAAEAVLLVAADAGGTLLGTVTYADAGTRYADIAREGEAEFRMLGVDPAARGRGVGEALVRACVDRARAQGRSRLVLSTHETMRAAHRLYERLGFQRTPERDWSPSPDTTLRVYQLNLQPSAT